MEFWFNNDLIYDYINKNNLNKNSFCKLCGISFSTLKKLLNNEFNIGYLTVLKVTKVLNVPINKYFICSIK